MQGPLVDGAEEASAAAASKPPEPEREMQSQSGEFAAVVAACKSSVAHWRDGAWFERYPSEDAAMVPPEQRMPAGMQPTDLLRYLAVFAINAWGLPHRLDRTDSEYVVLVNLLWCQLSATAINAINK